MQKIIKLEKLERPDYSEAQAAVRAFVDDVIAAQDEMTTPEVKVQVTLTFSEPTELYYGRRRGNVCATVHEVKKVFPSGGRLCYMAPAMRARVRYLPLFDLVSVTLTTQVRDYSEQWAAIARSMRKHHINLAVAKHIEAHLRGDEPHIKGFQNYWTIRDRPRKANFKDVTGGRTLQEMWALRSGDTFREQKCGERRDRSVFLRLHEDGSWYFAAASEYAGCGNGDYYMMYSPTMAFYAETD